MDQLVPTDRYSPYRFFTRRALGRVPRRHADDADRRRGAAAELALRSDRSRRSQAHLSVAVAPALGACRGEPAAVSPAPGLLQRARRGQDAVHHRHGRLGRGRQVDHGAHPEGAAGALAVEPEGRSRHHRRLPLSQRASAPRKPDGAQGLSRQLRRRRAAALPVGHQVRASPTSARRSIRTSPTTCCPASS